MGLFFKSYITSPHSSTSMKAGWKYRIQATMAQGLSKEKDQIHRAVPKKTDVALSTGGIPTRAISAIDKKRRNQMGRLKIHLPVDEQTEQFCRMINRQIQGITDSAIVFSDASFMIPHITLVLGELVPSQTFEGLTTVTQAVAQQIKPLRLKLSQPYIDARSYVVCAVQENRALTELRTSMCENIMGYYLTTRFHHNDIAHLTLAHIDAQHKQVNTYLKKVKKIPPAVCTHIEISHIGPKGSCIDHLFTTCFPS